MASTQLTEHAFGADPGRWPLPAATTPEQHWLRAVAAGGQGQYGVAEAELTALRRTARGPLLSLAHSTQGSLVRQLGGHRLARRWDGRALVLAGADPQARVDALIGLAADALGTERFALSATLLQRARSDLEAAVEPPARLAVRLAWVGAELAMATGDGATALHHAQRGVEHAVADGLGTRHVVKSNVVLAAALCCTGRLPAARALADEMLDAAARHGLIPLRWALACLLDGIGSDVRTTAEIVRIRDESAEVIGRRGGHWASG